MDQIGYNYSILFTLYHFLYTKCQYRFVNLHKAQNVLNRFYEGFVCKGSNLYYYHSQVKSLGLMEYAGITNIILL